MTAAIRIRRPLLVFALLLLFAASAANAMMLNPAPIAGQVLDSSTGQPIAGASVLLNDGWGVTSTSADGRFSIHNLSPDEYTLQIRHLGYLPEQRTVQLSEGDALRLLLTLTPEPIALDTVDFRLDSDRQGYHLNSGQLRAHDFLDVADAVDHLPGVQLYSQGGTGSRAVVSLRGSRPDHVRVEVDGIPLNNGSGDAVDLNSIPLRSVHSIEVDPATAPGAPGGSVRITTLAGAADPASRWSAAVQGQSPRTLSADLSAARHTIDGSGVRLRARYLASDGNFDYQDEFGQTRSRINNDRERLNFLLGGETRLAGLRLEGSGSLDGLAAGSPGPLYQPPTPDARQRELRWRGQLRARDETSPAGLSVTLFADGHRREYSSPREQLNPATGQTILQPPVDIEDHGFRGSARLLAPVKVLERGRWTVHAGLLGEASLETFESVDRNGTGSVSRTGGHVQRGILAGETRLQTRWQGDHWRMKLLTDLRLDRLRDTVEDLPNPFDSGGDTHVSGRALLRISPVAGRWSLETGAGSALAVPSFQNRFLVESVFALGNPELKPERVRELHSGLTLTQPLPGDVSMSGSLRGYLRETSDLVVWRRNWRGQYFPDNLDRALARGLESSLTLQHPGPVHELSFALTWQRVVNATVGSPYNGNRIPFQPDLFGNIGLSLQPISRLSLGFDLRFASQRYSSESNLDSYSVAGVGLDPYTLLDLNANWRQPLPESHLQLTVSAGVENVTNVEYALLERYPMPGRIWTLGLSVKQLASP